MMTSAKRGTRRLKTATPKLSLVAGHDKVQTTVAEIIADVRLRGDSAVRDFSERFDGWSPASFRLTPDEIEEIVASVPDEVLRDIQFAQEQIRRFAEMQLASMSEFEFETLPGVFLGQRNIPIGAVGAYVPGGRYPLLSSASMTIIPAKVAGVPRVASCTPPIHGEIYAASVAAMHLAGADEIYVLGGAQAVAALAVGTETIQRIDMMTGPGNTYVTEAKRQLFGEIGIDLVAGPTEVLVVADETAEPFTVAVDLLGQAEHGPDSPAILITTSEELGNEVIELIDRLLPDMPTRDYAEPAWRNFGEVLVVDDLEEAYRLADEFASEHVEILTAEPREALARMRNYGALFLGSSTCVPFGDKVIGTNHVLPTAGAAHYTGGLWVGKFIKTVTFQEVTDFKSAAELGEVCARISRIERFEGHARSADVRVSDHTKESIPWDPRLNELG
jgi:sulfopropanediol 3-dehydrogenase